MKPIWGAIAFGTLLTAALPALADVKAGVDAWQQGHHGLRHHLRGGRQQVLLVRTGFKSGSRRALQQVQLRL